VAKAESRSVPEPVAEAKPLAQVEPEAPSAPVAEEKPAKSEKSEKITLPSGRKIKQDDLKMVEGIGPKIEGLLNDAGIVTWNDLANAPVEKVQAILDEAGPRYRMHQPTTWAKQADMADKGQWELLEKYQDWLDGGKAPEGETFEG
jgi:large subunit ribosomal protein L27